jgi:hypothetical protein
VMDGDELAAVITAATIRREKEAAMQFTPG